MNILWYLRFSVYFYPRNDMLCETVQQVNALKRSENIQRINDPNSNGLRCSVLLLLLLFHHIVSVPVAFCQPETPYPHSHSLSIFYLCIYFFLGRLARCSTVALLSLSVRKRNINKIRPNKTVRNAQKQRHRRQHTPFTAAAM